MMTLIKNLTTSVFLLWTGLSCATLTGAPKGIKEADSPVLLMTEVISAPLLRDTAIKMLKQKAAATIYIDSPGGDYMAAKAFGEFLKQRRILGLPTTCFAGPNVMSAAYYIFLHCDKRYVLRSTLLFPHKIHVWFSQPISGPMMVEEGTAVIQEQANWDGKARMITGMSEVDYLAFRDSDNQFWSVEKVEALSRNKWFEVVDGYTFNVVPN